MAKLLGLILMLLGIAMLVVKFAFKDIFGKIPFLSTLTTLWIVIVALVLIAVGYLFFRKGRGQASAEVPIYQGGKIVGYRRK